VALTIDTATECIDEFGHKSSYDIILFGPRQIPVFLYFFLYFLCLFQEESHDQNRRGEGNIPLHRS
jgi:hypothetical protein